MARNIGLILILLATAVRPSSAQGLQAHGTVRDLQSNVPVAQVPVRLTDPGDTTDVHVGVSREDGTFTIPGLSRASYRLDAVRIGYAPLQRMIAVTLGDTDLGTILLAPSAVHLPGLLVRGSPPPAEQRADTVEFNAKAVKTNPDADAGDLIQKMPGVTVNNGTVKSNGETVQQVLVDGRPYFGQDPSIALHNLPAEVIDKIQVFDKMSDQAEFTGFDDGQSIKTMNLVLTPEKRNSGFGKIYAGTGNDGRYLTGGNANVLQGVTRLSLIGIADNVNQQNFSAQDLFGVLNTSSQRGGAFLGGPNGGRSGGGGRGRGGSGGRGGFGGGGGGGGGGQIGGPSFLVGQQDGVTATGSAGANFSGRGWKGLSLNQSYFYNQGSNRNTQRLDRLYAVPVDSVASYRQNTSTPNRNYNHRYEGRFVDTLSTATSIIDTPRLFFQRNRSSSTLSGANFDLSANPLSQAESDNAGSTSGNNLSNHLILRHRFAARGRTISVDLGAGSTLKNGQAVLHSLSSQGQTALPDTLDQHNNVRSTSTSLSARLAYTEPLGEATLLQLSYNPRVTDSRSDNRAFLRDPASGGFTLPDTALSNSFTSRSSAQSGGAGIMRRQGALNFMANLSYQASALHERQTQPSASKVDRSFRGLLPSLFLNYNVFHQKNLRLFLNTQTRVPDLSQLQNLVDTSNPLSLTMGNPDLKESYVQTMLCRYSITDPTHGRSIFLLISFQRISDYLANSTLTARRDSVLASGDTLKAGSQLVRPVNLNGYWSANSFVTYSRPVGLLKSVLSLNGGLTYSRTPGLVNRLRNEAGATTLTAGTVLGSNVSEKIDFTLSYTGNYNLARNSAQSASSSRYYSHTGSLKCDLIGWRGLTLRNELTNSLTSGLGSGYDQNAVLWNLGVGKKVLSDQSLEVRLSATDLLNQNRSVNRTVSDTYVQDTENLTLRRYLMLSLTYTRK